MKEKLVLFLVFFLLVMCIPMMAMGFSLPQAPAPGGETSQAGSEEPSQASGEESQPQSQPEPAQQAQGEITAQVPTEKTFKILNENTGKVEEVSIRDYVRGAVCAEMPPDFALEALKAQAVAAHTYALRLQQEQKSSPNEKLKGADFSARPQDWLVYTTEEQARERFGDKFEQYWQKICQAADEVVDEILLYEEQPIVAAYHSMSAGKTEDAKNVWEAGAPYLVPAESFGDTLAPDYETTVKLTSDEVKALLQAQGEITLPEDPAGWFSAEERSDSGYLTQIQAGDKTFTGNELRNIFSLRSSNVQVGYQDNAFTFTVKGYGHGVGLSQYGADYMARQGDGYRDILAHYYPGTTLAKAVY